MVTVVETARRCSRTALSAFLVQCPKTRFLGASCKACETEARLLCFALLGAMKAACCSIGSIEMGATVFFIGFAVWWHDSCGEVLLVAANIRRLCVKHLGRHGLAPAHVRWGNQACGSLQIGVLPQFRCLVKNRSSAGMWGTR